MAAQFGQQARTAGTTVALFLVGACGRRVQLGLQVFVAEPIQGMLAAQGGGKELAVLSGDRLESGVAPPLFGAGLAQAIQVGDRLASGLSVSHGFQVAGIGLKPDLHISPEVRHAFAHRQPPPLFARWGVTPPQDAKLARIIDRGFDPEDIGRVIPFDRIALQVMFDAPAFGAAFEVGDDVALEVAMRLATQIAQHIFGAERSGGQVHPRWNAGFETGSISEEHVGGVFGLINDPVITRTTSGPEERQVRVDLFGPGIKESRPLAVGKLLAHGLRGF